MTNIRQATTAYNYGPVNECIYCGSKENLSDEHIIPYALTKLLVLPKASCPECAQITSKIENKVLRGFMFDARVVGDMPTRRKKNRPEHINIKFINHDDTVSEKKIHKSKAAAFLTLPMFNKAGFMGGKAIRNGILIRGQETLHFGKNTDKLAKEHGASGLRISSQIAITEFIQVIAKIAYAYLVAELGLFERSESPLLDIIMGREQCYGCWVGSDDFRLEVEEQNPTHALGIREVNDGKGNVGYVVLLKLFAYSKPTGYLLAGRIPDWQNMVMRD